MASPLVWPGSGRAADAHRRIVVEADDLGRPDLPAHGRERCDRHQFALAVADAELEDVVGLHAPLVIGLDDDALHAAAVREVVDVGGAEVGGDRVVDILEGDAEGCGLFAVDHQLDLRRRRQSLDVHVLQHRASLGRCEQLVLCLHQCNVAALAAVLQAKAEAGRVAEIIDRRRLKRGDLRVLDRCECPVGVVHDCLGRVLRAALRPVLQRDEGLRGVLALAEEAETGEERDRVDPAAIEQDSSRPAAPLRRCD